MSDIVAFHASQFRTLPVDLTGFPAATAITFNQASGLDVRCTQDNCGWRLQIHGDLTPIPMEPIAEVVQSHAAAMHPAPDEGHKLSVMFQGPNPSRNWIKGSS